MGRRLLAPMAAAILLCKGMKTLLVRRWWTFPKLAGHSVLLARGHTSTFAPQHLPLSCEVLEPLGFKPLPTSWSVTSAVCCCTWLACLRIFVRMMPEMELSFVTAVQYADSPTMTVVVAALVILVAVLAILRRVVIVRWAKRARYPLSGAAR